MQDTCSCWPQFCACLQVGHGSIRCSSLEPCIMCPTGAQSLPGSRAPSSFIAPFAVQWHGVFERCRRHQSTAGKNETGLIASLAYAGQITVRAAKGLVEPKHMMRTYGVRGTDGRVFTIFDHDSAITEGANSRPTKTAAWTRADTPAVFDQWCCKFCLIWRSTSRAKGLSSCPPLTAISPILNSSTNLPGKKRRAA